MYAGVCPPRYVFPGIRHDYDGAAVKYQYFYGKINFRIKGGK